jgi:hypothetical protein
MRADITARTTYYSMMSDKGALNPNEIRANEGLNKREGGDTYTISANTRSEADKAKITPQENTNQNEDMNDEQASENN